MRSISWAFLSIILLARCGGGAIGAPQHVATRLAVTIYPPIQFGAEQSDLSGITLQLQEAGGANVPQAGVQVTTEIQSGGGTLVGTLTRATDASGAAVFGNLTLLGAPHDQFLRFTAQLNGSQLTTSFGPIHLDAGTPVALTMKLQPSSMSTSGAILAQQPVIQFVDAAGNPVPSGGVVTASVSTGSASLQGTLVLFPDASGAVRFTNLALTLLILTPGGGEHVTLGFRSQFLSGLQSVERGVVSSDILLTPLP